MALPWMPAVAWTDCGVNYSLAFTLPQREWVNYTSGVGSSRVMAGGGQVSFQVRRWHLCDVTLRYYESEWADVVEWLEWAQKSGETFTFSFDQNDASTNYTVYLHAPLMGEAVQPQRDPDFGNVYFLTVTLRTSGYNAWPGYGPTGTPFTEDLYGSW